MSPNQEKVLKALDKHYSEDFGFLSFAVIHRVSEVPRDLVRRTVRALARKGYAEFSNGLWDGDGPRGSGYRITKAGQTALKAEQGISK